MIVEATEVTEELCQAFARLTSQLSGGSPGPSRSDLEAVVDSPATILLLVREDGGDGRIVGSLTLVVFRVPTGVRAWIEDVVVDGVARGRGLGEALVREAMRRAQAAGARTVDLTSRPSREAANRLYRRLGFVPRETNLYRDDLGAR